MMLSEKDKNLLILCGLVFGTIGGVCLVLGTATRFTCGDWHLYSPDQTIEAVKAGVDFSHLSGVCGPSTAGVIWTAAVLFVVAVLAVVVVMAGVVRWRESDRYRVKELAARPGVASGREVNRKAGRKALKQKAAVLRPTLKKPQLADVGWMLGTSQGEQVWVSTEDSLLLYGPPRSGKGFFLVINAILDAPGAVITTSTRGDNVSATLGLRQKIGPCMTFDPQGLAGGKSALKWSPFQGCEDEEKASIRAQALMAATGLGKSSSNQEWAQQARIILQYLLHAAALGKVSIRDFARWGAAPELCGKAVEILQRHPDAAPGWGANLKAEVNSDPKTRQSKWLGVTGATEALSVGRVAESLDPGPGEKMLDPEEFIRNKGTLYLLGSKADGSAVAPFLIALMDEIVNTGKRMARLQPGNRLEPPMMVILDEIANLAPWEALAQVMADGGGSGISTMAIFQNAAQVRSQWGTDAAQALIDAAIVKVQLGGADNAEELRKFTDLMEERVLTDRNRSVSNQGGSTSENTRRETALTVPDLHYMPTGYGLMMSRNTRPVIMKMTRWTNRKDAKDIKESKRRYGQMLDTGGSIDDLLAGLEDASAPKKPKARIAVEKTCELGATLAGSTAVRWRALRKKTAQKKSEATAAREAEDTAQATAGGQQRSGDEPDRQSTDERVPAGKEG